MMRVRAHLMVTSRTLVLRELCLQLPSNVLRPETRRYLLMTSQLQQLELFLLGFVWRFIFLIASRCSVRAKP